MSIRTYLLYFALVILLLILIGALIWPFLHVDSRLRDALLSQLGASFEGTVDIKRVTPGFFALNLYGLEITDIREIYSLEVQEVRVDFSIWKFISHRFKILNSISDVTILHPEVTIRTSAQDSVSTNSIKRSSSIWELLRNLPDAVWIESVTLEQGILRLQNSRGENLITLQYLNGQVQSPEVGQLRGRLHGGSRNGIQQYNELKIRLDVEEKTFESTLLAQWGSIEVGQEFSLPDSLKLRVDSLNADLYLWSKGELNGLDGEIKLQNLALNDRTGRIIECDSLDFIFGDWKLLVPPTRAKGLTVEWAFTGEIPDMRDPILDFTISANSKESAPLTDWIPAGSGVKPSGKLTLQAQISGKVGSPKIQLQGNLEKLDTAIDQFRDIGFSGIMRESKFKLTRLETVCSSGDVFFSGSLESVSGLSEYQAEFTWRGSVPGILNSPRGSLKGTLTGSKGTHELKGRWMSSDTSQAPLELHMSASFPDDRLLADLRIPESASWAEVVVTDFSTKPRFHVSFEEPINILRRFYLWEHWNRFAGLYFSGELDGTLDEMSSRFEMFYGAGPSQFRFDGVISAGQDENISYAGALTFQQGSSPALNGSVVLDWRQHILILESLDLDNAIYAQGSLDFNTGEFGLTELHISNWDVSRGVQLANPEWGERLGGILNGRVEVYGSLDDPYASINFYASSVHYMEQTGFWVVLSAEIADDTLRVSECNMGRGVLGLVKFSGTASLDGSDLNFNLLSDRADLSDFFGIIGSNPLRLSGPLKLAASIGGSALEPTLNLDLMVTSGRLYKMPFERLEASVLMDSTTEDLLVVKELKLVQAPDLVVSGNGTLPLRKASLNLQLKAQGNVLHIPHLIEKDIPVSEGRGEISIELGQTEGRIRLQNARLSIQNGRMKFPDVVDEIKSIQADMHLEGNRVIIAELSGEIDRQRFRIGNYFNATADSGQLQHLYFHGMDLDLGIITLETSGRGLYARIPTLMLKGIKGHFRMSGKTNGEHFTFAGPIDHPLIRGKIQVSGTIITYPFPQGKKRPSAFTRAVLSVLKSARWDLDVQPERGNRYEREIQSMAGTPLLEEMSGLLTTVDISLNVNPAESKLKVLGCMDDGTFGFLGSLISTRGTIEYLDMKFNVDRFTVEFDEHDPLPWVEGRGEAVYLDSLGQTRNIYLTLYVVDPVTGERTQRGRWGDFVFIIEDDAGSSQEQILAAMGYSPEQLPGKVTSISGMIISNAVVRRWIRPIERELEVLLQLDYIRLQPTIAQHLFETQLLGLDPGPESNVDWGAYFLRQSRLSVGKYISDDLFLTYTGLWESAINAQNERHFGFLHRWNLEYRIRPISKSLLINFAYEYDSLEQLRDREITLRYSILF